MREEQTGKIEQPRPRSSNFPAPPPSNISSSPRKARRIPPLRPVATGLIRSSKANLFAYIGTRGLWHVGHACLTDPEDVVVPQGCTQPRLKFGPSGPGGERGRDCQHSATQMACAWQHGDTAGLSHVIRMPSNPGADPE